MLTRRSLVWPWLAPLGLVYAVTALLLNYRVTFDWQVAWVALNAVVLAATPLILHYRPSGEPSAHVQALGVLSALRLVTYLPMVAMLPATASAKQLIDTLTGAVLINLTHNVIGRPLQHHEDERRSFTAGNVLFMLFAIYLGLQPFYFEGEFLNVGVHLSPLWLARVFLVAATLTAWLTMLRRLGQEAFPPRRYAALMMALVMPMTSMMWMFAWWFSAQTLNFSSFLLQATAEWLLLAGFIGTRDFRWRAQSRRWTTYLVAGFAGVVVSSGIYFFIARSATSLIEQRLVFAYGSLLVLISAGAFFYWLTSVSKHRALSGRRLHHALQQLGQADTMEAMIQVTLQAVGAYRQPLEGATGALLTLIEPAQTWSLDAAGEARAHLVSTPRALVEYFTTHEDAPLVTRALAQDITRRPHLRAVLEQLEDLSARAAWPVRFQDHLLGVLVVPNDGKPRRIRVEEWQTLEILVERVAQILSLLLDGMRRQTHIDRQARDNQALTEQVDQLQERLDKQDRKNLLTSLLIKSDNAHPTYDSINVRYSNAMQNALHRARELAPLDVPILIYSEVGNAINTLARYIHDHAARVSEPFVLVDLSSIPASKHLEGLIGRHHEGEDGWLKMAAAGTLVLEHVAELHPDAQSALVRALAERKVSVCDPFMAGYPLDCRIIMTCETAQEPSHALRHLDQELVHWLEASQLRLPPLRERLDDLGSLTLMAIERAYKRQHVDPVGIDPEAMEKLASYAWPGNVVELEHVIYQAVRRASGTRILADDLQGLGEAPRFDAQTLEPMVFRGSYDELERKILTWALRHAGGNKSHAAKQLGLKRTTLIDKLKRFGLADEPDATRAEQN